MEEKIYTGISEFGTPDQVEKLFDFRELVSAPVGVEMKPTTPDKWKIWPKRNQETQSSCVYHARGKMAGILREKVSGEFVEYSAADYNKRSNKPAEGASPIEALNKMRTEGIGFEILEPTNNIGYDELARMKQSQFEAEIAKVSLLDAYYALPGYNFDNLVSTLHATQKPIMVGFFATGKEWNKDILKILTPGLTLAQAAIRHEVCATINYGTYQGLEGFTIEDSYGDAGILGKGVRWVTREFFEKRNYIPGLVPTTFKNYTDIGVTPDRPRISLTRDLQLGMSGDDVRQLQVIMKYEGFFPANHPGSDYFGGLTQECVQKYQAKYGIVSSGTPKTTGFGRVGSITRQHINNKYK